MQGLIKLDKEFSFYSEELSKTIGGFQGAKKKKFLLATVPGLHFINEAKSLAWDHTVCGR